MILIVDDEAAVAEVVSLVLNAAGHETMTASSRSEARNLIENTQFQGAIIDVWLDKEDGLTIAAMLNRAKPPIPFIVMSGGGRGRTLETVTARADSLGASAMLFKPFDDDELLDAIAAMKKR